MVASTSMTPLSRSENFVISTAVPWGISLSRHSSSFSRRISPITCRSGWSVVIPSGNSWGPSWAYFRSSFIRSFRPLPVWAEMGMIASKPSHAWL